MSINNFLDLCGWIDSPSNVEEVKKLQKYPSFGSTYKHFGLTAKKETTLLHEFLIKNRGSYPVLTQGTGDCTSFGLAGAIDVLRGVQLFLLRTSETIIELTATEPIYALGRVEIGRGMWSGGQGASGASVAEAVKRYGTLVRKKYDKYDLTKYDSRRADSWGESGLPDVLEPVAAEHQVKTISECNSAEEVIAAITNGYPVTMASNYGFTSTRDRNGFSSPSGSWPHQMFIAAYRTDIEGVLVINSWGAWNSGPKVLNQPDGSFWITTSVLDSIVRSRDSEFWAISNFDGYKPQNLDWGIF